MVNFLAGKRLDIDAGFEPFNGWLFAGDNESAFQIINATFELLGFSGAGGAGAFYDLGDVSGGDAHIGPDISGLLNPGQSVSFSGYRVTYDILSIAQSPHTYDEIWFICTETMYQPASAIQLTLFRNLVRLSCG